MFTFCNMQCAFMDKFLNINRTGIQRPPRCIERRKFQAETLPDFARTHREIARFTEILCFPAGVFQVISRRGHRELLTYLIPSHVPQAGKCLGRLHRRNILQTRACSGTTSADVTPRSQKSVQASISFRRFSNKSPR